MMRIFSKGGCSLLEVIPGYSWDLEDNPRKKQKNPSCLTDLHECSGRLHTCNDGHSRFEWRLDTLE